MLVLWLDSAVFANFSARLLYSEYIGSGGDSE